MHENVTQSAWTIRFRGNERQWLKYTLFALVFHKNQHWRGGENQSSRSPLKMDASLCQSNHVRCYSPRQYLSYRREMKRELVRAGALLKARADGVISIMTGWPLLRPRLPKKQGKIGEKDINLLINLLTLMVYQLTFSQFLHVIINLMRLFFFKMASSPPCTSSSSPPSADVLTSVCMRAHPPQQLE